MKLLFKAVLALTITQVAYGDPGCSSPLQTNDVDTDPFNKACLCDPDIQDLWLSSCDDAVGQCARRTIGWNEATEALALSCRDPSCLSVSDADFQCTAEGHAFALATGFSVHCYFWAEYCLSTDSVVYKGLQAHLATITTQTEYDLVYKMVEGWVSTSFASFYFGLRQSINLTGTSKDQGGPYTWVTGEPFNEMTLLSLTDSSAFIQPEWPCNPPDYLLCPAFVYNPGTNTLAVQERGCNGGGSPGYIVEVDLPLQTFEVDIDVIDCDIPIPYDAACEPIDQGSLPDLLQSGVEDCADGVKNHGKFVSCVAKMAKDGGASDAQKDALVSCAAQSNVGKRLRK